jgi:hypothetical protein
MLNSSTSDYHDAIGPQEKKVPLEIEIKTEDFSPYPLNQTANEVKDQDQLAYHLGYDWGVSVSDIVDLTEDMEDSLCLMDDDDMSIASNECITQAVFFFQPIREEPAPSTWCDANASGSVVSWDSQDGLHYNCQKR